MALEQLLDALNDSGSVDPATQHAPVVKPAAMQGPGMSGVNQSLKEAPSIEDRAGNAAGWT